MGRIPGGLPLHALSRGQREGHRSETRGVLHHRLYVQLDGVDGFPLGWDNVEFLVHGERVSHLTDVIKPPPRRR